MVGWLVGRSVGWLVGRSVGHSVGWLVDWLVVELKGQNSCYCVIPENGVLVA